MNTQPGPMVLSRAQAAEVLGVSLQTFKRHVQPQLHTVSIGRRVVVPVKAIEFYLSGDETAHDR